MSRHNSCFVVGNIGSDPVERSRTAKAGAIVGFTVAENVRSFDEKKKAFETVHTNWFQVTTFGQTAERVKKALKKGDRVAIQGRMKISKFTDRSGEERSGFEILADEVAIWQGLPSVEGDNIPF